MTDRPDLSLADLEAVFQSARRENEGADPLPEPAYLARFLELEDPGGIWDKAGDDRRPGGSGCSERGVEAGLPADANVAGDPARAREALLERWRQGPRRLVFHTSGSTGSPRPYAHEYDSLVEEALTMAPAPPDCGRVVSVMPTHHIFGFVFSLVLPKVLGRPAVFFPPMVTADLLDALRPGDLLVAFPLFWDHLLEAAPRLPDGLRGMSATAPLAGAVWEGLARKGLAGLTEVYGATEVSALARRRRPGDPFSLLAYWEKETGPDGGCAGFFRRLPSGGLLRHPLLDRLDWTSEREFVPAGRTDGVVQVAGVNVSPAEVERRLRAVPGVRDCRVRLMRPDEGARLKAFIVPDGEAGLTARDLRRRLREDLPAPAVPRSFTFGPRLPRTATGKATDW